MTFKMIFLKLFKSVSFWITIILLFASIIGYSMLYFSKGYTEQQSNSITIPYKNLDELKEYEKNIDESKDTFNKEQLNHYYEVKQLIKVLKENKNIKENNYYYRKPYFLSKNRYDFLITSSYLVFFLILIAVITTTYRIFGEDFNVERSYLFIYHNKNRIPSLFKRLGAILLINFILTSLFSFIIWLLSLTYKQSHGYIMYNFADYTNVYSASTYYFIYYYLVNLFNMFITYLVVNSIFLLTLKKVISSVISYFIGFIFMFATFTVFNNIKEVTQPVFGQSSLNINYTTSVILKISILIILIIIFFTQVLFFKKRDLK